MKINKWYMTDDEIRRSWRQAADKAEQVKIIAELNAQEKADVIEKLKEIGEHIPDELKASKGRRPKYKINAADERKIWKERAHGTPYWKIARMLGGTASESCIQMRYEKMRGDYIAALPTIKKTLQAVAEAAPRHIVSDDDREIIKAFIRRFL